MGSAKRSKAEQPSRSLEEPRVEITAKEILAWLGRDGILRPSRNADILKKWIMCKDDKKREALLVEITAVEILSWRGTDEWMKLSDLITQIRSLGDSAPQRRSD